MDCCWRKQPSGHFKGWCLLVPTCHIDPDLDLSKIPPKLYGSVNNLLRILNRGGIWLAVGNLGEIWKSDDGIRWDKIYTLSTASLVEIDHSMGRWVVIGSSGGAGILLTSTNLSEWETYEFPANPLLDIAVGEGTWWVQGQRENLHSTNGTEWKAYPTETWDHFIDLAYGDSYWFKSLASGTGDLMANLFRSEDGFRWEHILGPFLRVGNAGPVWYEGGRWWMMPVSQKQSFPESIVQVTDDGVDWHKVYEPFHPADILEDVVVRHDKVHLFYSHYLQVLHLKETSPVSSVALGIDDWMAIGQGRIETSVDGINWHVDESIPDLLNELKHALAFGNGQWAFLELDSNRSIPRLRFFTYSADDGLRLEFNLSRRRESEVIPRQFLHTLDLWWIVTSKFVVTAGESLVPTVVFNGTNFLQPSEDLLGFAHSSNRVMTLSSDGNLFVTDDWSGDRPWAMVTREKWLKEPAPSADWKFHEFACHNGIWLILATYKAESHTQFCVIRSSDGVRWETIKVEDTLFGTDTELKLAYGNGWWVLIGGGGEENRLKVFISKTGVDWKKVHQLETTAVPVSLQFGLNQWIAALSDGSRLRSGPDFWLQANIQPDSGNLTVRINGKAHATIRLERSIDMKTWHTWETVTTQSLPTELEMLSDQNTDQSFVRGVVVTDQ